MTPTESALLKIIRAHIADLRAAGRTKEAARLHYAIEAALL